MQRQDLSKFLTTVVEHIQKASKTDEVNFFPFSAGYRQFEELKNKCQPWLNQLIQIRSSMDQDNDFMHLRVKAILDELLCLYESYISKNVRDGIKKYCHLCNACIFKLIEEFPVLKKYEYKSEAMKRLHACHLKEIQKKELALREQEMKENARQGWEKKENDRYMQVYAPLLGKMRMLLLEIKESYEQRTQSSQEKFETIERLLTSAKADAEAKLCKLKEPIDLLERKKNFLKSQLNATKLIVKEEYWKTDRCSDNNSNTSCGLHCNHEGVSQVKHRVPDVEVREKAQLQLAVINSKLDAALANYPVEEAKTLDREISDLDRKISDNNKRIEERGNCIERIDFLLNEIYSIDRHRPVYKRAQQADNFLRDESNIKYIAAVFAKLGDAEQTILMRFIPELIRSEAAKKIFLAELSPELVSKVNEHLKQLPVNDGVHPADAKAVDAAALVGPTAPEIQEKQADAAVVYQGPALQAAYAPSAPQSDAAISQAAQLLGQKVGGSPVHSGREKSVVAPAKEVVLAA